MKLYDLIRFLDSKDCKLAKELIWQKGGLLPGQNLGKMLCLHTLLELGTCNFNRIVLPIVPPKLNLFGIFMIVQNVCQFKVVVLYNIGTLESHTDIQEGPVLDVHWIYLI